MGGGWPRVPPHYPLTREIRFSGPFFTRSRKIGSGGLGTRGCSVGGHQNLPSDRHETSATAITESSQTRRPSRRQPPADSVRQWAFARPGR